MENKYLHFFKLLATISASIFLILATLMFFQELIYPDWKVYQKTYRDLIQDDEINTQAVSSRAGVKQIAISGTNHIDRCLTCHLTTGSAIINELPLPFSGHPPKILKDHDLSAFGCTLCHPGVGRSLIYDETCNPETVPDWKPIQSNCSHCHLAVFNSTPDTLLPDMINQGRDLFYASGCLGCHKLRDTGGRFGPDLTQQSEKIRQGYNFRYVQGDRTIFNWHMEHFKNPSMVSPGSVMPDFEFDPAQRELLTTFILGLSRPNLPFRYYNLKVLKEFKGQRDLLDIDSGYSLICSACHGEKGLGRDYKTHAFGVPGLANPDFQAIASTDMIAFLVEEGRGNRYMPSWKSKHSGLGDAEIKSLIKQVRRMRAAAPAYEQVRQASADRKVGLELYLEHCSSCHNTDLSGGIGPSLNNQSFTRLASDLFLYQTLTRGRANTAMPSWSRLDAVSLKSLIRYILPTEKIINGQKSLPASPAAVRQGEEIFHYQCSRCHGEEGQGGIGPAILKPDFLQAASDVFIRGMISRGRSHTPMFGIMQKDEELLALVQFMRSRQDSRPDYIDPGPILGNQASGKKLFYKYCKKCHGENGEGIEAPALNNQEFLNAASNGYLLATITMGRENTPMPAWGKNRQDQRSLTVEERQDLTTHIRHWQTLKISSRLISKSSQN